MAQMEVGATWDWFPARIHTGRHGQKYARRIMANGATRKKAVAVKSTITINEQGSLKNNRRIADMEYELKQARAEHHRDDQRQLHHSMGQHLLRDTIRHLQSIPAVR